MRETLIVFIHGAGLNRSIWEELLKRLDLPALPVNFPNRFNGKANAQLTFDQYVDSVAQQITNSSAGRFIMVAHSIGACIALKVAGMFSKKLTGFVAISSVIPPSGGSFISALPFPQRFIMPVILRLSGTSPPRKVIEKELCNDLSAEQRDKVVKEFTPESAALYTTRFHYQIPPAKRLYVKLTNDNSLPVSLQEKMALNLKADIVREIHSGHLPMISQPVKLAGIISEFWRDTD